MRSVVLIVGLCLSACGGDTKPPLVATHIVVSKPIPGMRMSAGYLSLTNNTKDAISITRVTSDDFEAVEIHESLLEDGVAKMQRIQKLMVPANSSVSLEPGGKHLMLMRPSNGIDTVSLSFYSDDTLILSVDAPLTPRNN